MKNAMVIPSVLVVTLLISMLIGTYMMGSSVHISKEYHRDLAEVRGFWGAYGAKELNNTVGSIERYIYRNYNIEVNRINLTTWEWNLTIPSSKESGITNDDLYENERNMIVLDGNNPNEIKSYEK